MKPVDHSECAFDDCIHKRDIVMAADAEASAKKRAGDREAAYYERKRREKAVPANEFGIPGGVDGATKFGPPEEHFGMRIVDDPALPPGVAYAFEDTASWRRRKVELLEEELAEARADMAAHGDPMPLQDIRNVVGDALRLLEAKNAKYGDAWRAQGYMGNLARLQSKVERLKNMLWRDADGNGYPLPANHRPDGETIVDTLLDLVNLAAMMAVNWTDENRWGGRRD